MFFIEAQFVIYTVFAIMFKVHKPAAVSCGILIDSYKSTLFKMAINSTVLILQYMLK